jgi:hypothetical protein
MLRKITISMVICLVAVLVLSVSFAQAGGNPPGLKKFVENLVAAGIAEQHAELDFSVEPGGCYSFALPAVQKPVRIDVSFSLLNGGTQTPSELMSALVNKDPSSGQMTWIGTSNDGTQQGSNSLSGTQIAFIFGGASPTVNATLEVDDLSAGTLKICQNQNTTSLTGHYKANLWY